MADLVAQCEHELQYAIAPLASDPAHALIITSAIARLIDAKIEAAMKATDA